MPDEVQCAECKGETPAGSQCTLCGAPLTWPPIAPADNQQAAPRKGDSGAIIFWTVLTAGSVLLLTLSVVSGFLPRSSPAHETPGNVAANDATFGVLAAICVTLLILEIWRRRR